MFVLTIFNQILILFLLMGTGYVLAKKNKMDDHTADQLTFLLCYVIMPCVVFAAFQKDFDPVMFHNLIIVAGITVLVHLIFIFLSYVLFNKKTVPSEITRHTLQFSSIYSNCGFMGFPLLSTLVGMQGVFYGSVYVGIYGLFLWTHGFLLYSERFDFKSLMNVILNPNILVMIIVIPMYMLSIHLPTAIVSPIKYLADLNTALSMLVIGATMTSLPISNLFSDMKVWLCVLVRNFILPIIVLLLFAPWGLGKEVLLSIVILSACPTAGLAVLFARLTGSDVVFPGKIMAFSTIASFVSMPVLIIMVHALG